MNGGENKFAFLIDRKEKEVSFHDLPFPKDSHKVLITKASADTLVANISFYGSNYETGIFLSSNFNKPFDIDGLICDWQQRREISFEDFIIGTTDDKSFL